MAVNLKLGSQVFSKERKIADLEKQVQQLLAKVSHYEELNCEFEVRHKAHEKSMFEMKNRLDLLTIENEQ